MGSVGACGYGTRVSPRPLALVTALTGADFALWNWSLSANHTVLALVSGLTLPPLAAACALMLAIGGARLAARMRPMLSPALRARAARGRRAAIASATPRGAHARPPKRPVRSARARGEHPSLDPDAAPAAPAQAGTSPARPPRKLAA